MFVKPTGAQVIDVERRRWLPEEGAEVPSTQYWLRRLLDGSVVEAEPPTSAPAQTGITILTETEDDDR